MANPTGQPEQASELDLGSVGTDARAVIDRLDATRVEDRPEGVVASVRPGELVVQDAAGERSLPMPADLFYLSVAPYVDGTHECFFHSLTTCLGELRNTDVEISVVDAATGETVMSQSARTFDNGFVGLWLPAGIDAVLTITAEGRSATAEISTHADDPTCLTTLQLA